MGTEKEKEKLFFKNFIDDEEEEECNDVCVYQTLQYPPKSTPPTPE